MSFYPGQRVVCVKDDGNFAPWKVEPGTDMGGLKKGTVYTVRDVGAYGVQSAIWLVEIIRKPLPKTARFGEPGYSPKRFRPLDESRLDIFRQHLVNPPKEEELA